MKPCLLLTRLPKRTDYQGKRNAIEKSWILKGPKEDVTKAAVSTVFYFSNFYLDLIAYQLNLLFM